MTSDKQLSDEEPSCALKQIISKNINGKEIRLQIIVHDDKLCHEFVIESPKFCFKRWLMWTAFFNILGYYAQLHSQDSRLMIGLIVVLLILTLIKLNFKVKKESLLVIASIGVQLTTTFSSGRTTSMFYDVTHVKDIVINEAITMHRVIYYLVLLLDRCSTSEEEEDVSRLVPLYSHSWPSLNCLILLRTEILRVLGRRDTRNRLEG